jgi:MFS transporter, PPP family, 3-phenylpropionic acid transporter
MTAELAITSKRLPAFWNGSLYYLVTFLCAGSLNPFLYVYFSELGLNGEQIGLISSLGPIMTMLLATAIASFADRKRKRILVLQIALFCTCIIVFLLRLPTTFASIALLMFFLAIFSSPVMSLGEGLIARMAQRNKLNYGAMRLWGSFGYALSSLGFGVLWQILGFKVMFVVASLFYLPLIFLARQLEEGPVIPQQERKPFFNLLRDNGLLLLLVATFLAAISNSLTMTFSGILVRSLGGGNFLVGAMIAGGAVAELPMMFYSDRISKRIHRTNAVQLSYGLMAVSYVGYMLAKDPVLLPFLTLIKGLGYGLWITTTIRLVTERTPEEWASTAQSLLTICLFGLAPLVAGPVGGWIHDAVNPGAVFGLGIFTLALASLVIFLAVRTRKLD